MSNPLPVQRKPNETWSWQQLEGIVDSAILAAPRLDWAQVDGRCIRYLVQSVAGSPWADQLALLSAILTGYAGLDAKTVLGHLQSLHPRWRALFPAYGLQAFREWQPTEHMPRYLSDSQFADTLNTRQEFLRHYASAATHTQAYVRALPAPEREELWRWVLPALPLEMHRQLSRRTELSEEAKRRRKEETDAMTPQFARIRGEAHLRWNALNRLRLKFQEAISLVESGQEALPLAMSYEEQQGLQRLHFVLWDRPGFVLAHSPANGAQGFGPIGGLLRGS
jgi:hypothetical protein